MIEIDGLTKRFGPVLAVDNVSFAVSRGEVLGFLGPNGAGKSTTMKMAAGFLTPTSGTARIAGYDILEQPIEVKKRLGYLPEGAPTYPDMTVAAFLDFVARVRGFSGAEKAGRVKRAMDLTQLAEVTYYPIETLSKGFKRRVGLAQALLHDPEVMILDEPTDGLDPNQKHEVRNLIRGMAAEKCIVISTHILEEVEAICTRAVIIARGRVLADGTPEELMARSRHHNAVILTLADAVAAEAEGALRTLPGVATIERASAGAGNTVLAVFPSAGKPIAGRISDLFAERKWQAQEIKVERGRLDDVFRAITLSRAA
ncbi:MAG: ABC transporter ATP-binding protein [Alphaproteobacteria bacterium]|nr:ABC transporter ATP-binding protein [Alphaproteobacteria bacterium]